jgi:hypothetical protein
MVRRDDNEQLSLFRSEESGGRIATLVLWLRHGRRAASTASTSSGATKHLAGDDPQRTRNASLWASATTFEFFAQSADFAQRTTLRQK